MQGQPANDIDPSALRHGRLARLRQTLAAHDCAGAVLFDPINIRYATDVSNMQVWCLHNPARYAFLATEGPAVVFEFPSCDHLALALDTVDEVRPAQSWVYLMAGPHAVDNARSWAREIADLVASHGGGNKRLAADRLDWIGFQALQREGIIVVEGQEVLEQSRVIKTPPEQQAMRAAVRACETGIGAMGKALVPGISEQELWSVLHQQNIASGGEWIETRLLASGPRTNPWYQECGTRIIEDGDLVAFDTDLIGQLGFCCDISRTWRAGDGQAGDRQRRAYAQAHDLIERLAANVGPGVSLKELAEKIGPPPEDAHVYSCLAHGVGLCDEYPVAFWQNQSHGYDVVLEPGMALCLESYLGPRDEGEGVKLEDQVLITEDGIERLSRTPFEEDWL